jgi:Domain of unknown function DUF302
VVIRDGQISTSSPPFAPFANASRNLTGDNTRDGRQALMILLGTNRRLAPPMRRPRLEYIMPMATGHNRQWARDRGGAKERLGKSGRQTFAAARLAMLVSGSFVALVPMTAQSAEPTQTNQTIAVEHIRIESAKPFADVRAALERSVPPLNLGVVKALREGDTAQIRHEQEQGPELSIFLVRDHGALLTMSGKARNALQYDIGNPITASLMTRHQLAAALYAPIRVVLYENEAGHSVFEYDLPSTTFGQFGDEQVTAVARGLDAALARALRRAAE